MSRVVQRRGRGAGIALVERVRQAVEELGYVPDGPRWPGDQAARRHRRGRSPRPETRVFADPFFAMQLGSISKELTAHDSQLDAAPHGGPRRPRPRRPLSRRRTWTALVFSLHLDDRCGLIRRAGVPTVFGGQPSWSEGDARPGLPCTSTCDWPGRCPRGRAALDSGLGPDEIAHITAARSTRRPRWTGSTGSGM
ncbi:hypothetical protein ACRAWF_42460 [Streptomyces sp. L7]